MPLDFRIISARNQSREELLERGEFLGDLLQRLKVIGKLHPIALKERAGRPRDIQDVERLKNGGAK